MENEQVYLYVILLALGLVASMRPVPPTRVTPHLAPGMTVHQPRGRRLVQVLKNAGLSVARFVSQRMQFGRMQSGRAHAEDDSQRSPMSFGPGDCMACPA